MYLKFGIAILLVLSQISCSKLMKKPSLESEQISVGMPGCCIVIGTNFCMPGWCSGNALQCKLCCGKFNGSPELI